MSRDSHAHSRAYIQGGGGHSGKEGVTPPLQGKPPRVVPQREFQQLERERPFFSGGMGVVASRVYPQCDSSSLGCSLTFRGDTNPVEVAG